MTTAFISHPDFFKHKSASHHPECPERLSAIEQQLKRDGLYDALKHFIAPRASHQQIARVHTERLIGELEHLSPQSGIAYVDPDTFMNDSSLDAAWHAAGAVVHATSLVVQGAVDNAFCAVRPPGHHAERNRAMGFCLFNHVAVAAASALEEHGLERVAIVDFDVHHGNGTENIFASDPRVLVCSTFQHPFYPYKGTETPGSNMINVPLASGTGSEHFQDAVRKRWLPALNAFKPQLLLVSAGFDAHAEDHLAHFELQDEDFAWVTSVLLDVAKEHAGGKIVSTLEGGYALDALARSVSLHVRTLVRL